MGAFKIEIVGVGGHGCDRVTVAGQKLYGRCGRFTCPDCLAFDFTQRLRQAGMVREGDTAAGQEVQHSPACNPLSDDGCTCNAIPDGAETYFVDAEGRIVEGDMLPPGGKQYWRVNQKAEFTHWPYDSNRVIDDMLKNERKSGSF